MNDPLCFGQLISYSFLFFISGCATQNLSSEIEVETHSDSDILLAIGFNEVLELSMNSNQRLEDKILRLYEDVIFPNNKEKLNGYYEQHSFCGTLPYKKPPPKTTKFVINGVREQYVPLSGKRVSIVYHLRLIPST